MPAAGAEAVAPLSGDVLRRRRLILIATIVGSSMAFIDGSVVNIALPTIGRDLDAGLAAQQWIMLSYSLAVASLYIVSGALGDRYGRWRLFVAGVVGFAAASTLAALAPNTAFLLSFAGLALFVLGERRSENPILPLELLRERVFVAANAYTLLVYAALGGSTFYLALYLQSGAVGYSPSRASLIFLPISIVMFVLAARFGRLADRDGPRRYLMAAPVVMSAGFALLTLTTGTNPLVPLPGVLVLALGLAMLVAPITATALKAAPDEYAGLAAGVNTTVSRLGGLIATPLLGVAITFAF